MNYLYEVSLAQIEKIVNYFAKSPNIEEMQIDKVYTDKDGHIVTLFATVRYRDTKIGPVVIHADRDFPTIGDNK